MLSKIVAFKLSLVVKQNKLSFSKSCSLDWYHNQNDLDLTLHSYKVWQNSHFYWLYNKSCFDCKKIRWLLTVEFDTSLLIQYLCQAGNKEVFSFLFPSWLWFAICMITCVIKTELDFLINMYFFLLPQAANLGRLSLKLALCTVKWMTTILCYEGCRWQDKWQNIWKWKPQNLKY